MIVSITLFKFYIIPCATLFCFQFYSGHKIVYRLFGSLPDLLEVKPGETVVACDSEWSRNFMNTLSMLFSELSSLLINEVHAISLRYGPEVPSMPGYGMFTPTHIVTVVYLSHVSQWSPTFLLPRTGKQFIIIIYYNNNIIDTNWSTDRHRSAAPPVGDH